MSLITIGRTVRKGSVERRFCCSDPFREMSIEFVIELLLFFGIAGVSIWPILAVAIALRELLQRTAH